MEILIPSPRKAGMYKCKLLPFTIKGNVCVPTLDRRDKPICLIAALFIIIFFVKVVGSQARILYSDQKGRISLAVAINRGIADGRIKVESLFPPSTFFVNC